MQNMELDHFSLDQVPLSIQSYQLGELSVGLVIVDEVKGFAAVGCGPLAPVAPDARIDQMIDQTNRLARDFVEAKRPILAFLDSHDPGKPELPYPPHCLTGSGHDDFVDPLTWLKDVDHVTEIKKDCINGFIGAINLDTGRNQVVDWINNHNLDAVLVVGICTDICVMDFVLTLLSARNHGLLGALRDVVVYEPACATYDLPRDVADGLALPPSAAHPRDLTHHMGLYFMAARGAVLADQVIV